MVSVLQANLISGFLECILFGIFFVTSTASLVLLLRRHRKHQGVPEIITIARSTSAFRWKSWAAALWSLRHSPLILATVIFMVTISAVGCPSSSLAELPSTETDALVASTARSRSIASSEG